MKQFLIKNFSSIIIIILFVVIMIQTCGDKKSDPKEVKRDTVVTIINHYYRDTTSSKPTLVKTIPVKEMKTKNTVNSKYSVYGWWKNIKWDTTYPPLNVDTGRWYEELHSGNIYHDTIEVSPFGDIKIIDTVSQNQIQGRGVIKNLIIPEKTTTITVTKTQDPKIKLYGGMGILGNQINPIAGISGGFMLKNKKEQMYGIEVKHIFRYGTLYEAKTYWDLKKLFK